MPQFLQFLFLYLLFRMAWSAPVNSTPYCKKEPKECLVGCKDVCKSKVKDPKLHSQCDGAKRLSTPGTEQTKCVWSVDGRETEGLLRDLCPAEMKPQISFSYGEGEEFSCSSVCRAACVPWNPFNFEAVCAEAKAESKNFVTECVWSVGSEQVKTKLPTDYATCSHIKDQSKPPRSQIKLPEGSELLCNQEDGQLEEEKIDDSLCKAHCSKLCEQKSPGSAECSSATFSLEVGTKFCEWKIDGFMTKKPIKGQCVAEPKLNDMQKHQSLVADAKPPRNIPSERSDGQPSVTTDPGTNNTRTDGGLVTDSTETTVETVTTEEGPLLAGQQTTVQPAIQLVTQQQAIIEKPANETIISDQQREGQLEPGTDITTDFVVEPANQDSIIPNNLGGEDLSSGDLLPAGTSPLV